MATIGEIEPSIRTQERAVQTGCVGGQIPTRYDYLSYVSYAISVTVLKAKEIGWRRHEETAQVPDRPGRQG